MPRIPFDDLPDDARLWVFAAHEPLDADAGRRLLGAVEAFLDGWAAHGAPLTAGCRLLEDRFLLVAVDPASVPPSGCSVDALTRLLKAEEARLGCRVLDHAPVYFRDEVGRIRRMSRNEFRDAASRGELTPDTPVFDTTLTALGLLRAGGLERAARDSWHGAAFFAGPLRSG
ncbi:MAG: hypothetical protein RQ751_00155 [Longimicrobiales bacterium]|nr:hypothetical protein [Longimicrobiales bacterium]